MTYSYSNPSAEQAAMLVSLSVDPPEVEAAFHAGLGVRWTFLSGSGQKYISSLDLPEMSR